MTTPSSGMDFFQQGREPCGRTVGLLSAESNRSKQVFSGCNRGSTSAVALLFTQCQLGLLPR